MLTVKNWADFIGVNDWESVIVQLKTVALLVIE